MLFCLHDSDLDRAGIGQPQYFDLSVKRVDRYAKKIKVYGPCLIHFQYWISHQRAQFLEFSSLSSRGVPASFTPMFLQEEIQSMIDAVEPPEKRVSSLALPLPCEVIWVCPENGVASNCNFKREHDDENMVFLCFPMFS